MASKSIKKKGFFQGQGMRRRSASVVTSPFEAGAWGGAPEFQAYLRALSNSKTHSTLVPDGENEILQSKGRLRSYSDTSKSVSPYNKLKDKTTSVLKTIPEKSSEAKLAKPKARRASVALGQNLTRDFTFVEDDFRENEEYIWSSVESFDSGEVEIATGDTENGDKMEMEASDSSAAVEVFAWLPDGNRVTLTGQPGMTVKELVADITMEYRIPRHMLRRASTLGIVHEDEKVSSIARQEIIIESRCVEETEEDADKRLAVLNEIISSERVYCNLLQSIFMTYKESLSKLLSMPKSDHTRIFSSVQQMVTVSAIFLTQLEEVAKSWNSETSTVGHLFDEEFFEEYKEYYAHFRVMRLLLIFLRNNNKNFVNLCREKRGTSWHNLDSLLLLPVQRVSQYDKYLSEYFDHTPPNHPDCDKVSQATRRVRMMVKDREDEVKLLENEIRLQQVQDRFPHDDLQLTDRDKDFRTQRFKALANRRRSAPSAVIKTALGGGKKLSSVNMPSPTDLQSLDMATEHSALNNNTITNRVYIMEGAIQITGGMQVQSRYVFLFNDVLIIAKANKSCTTFRVKHRLRVSELWLATCIDEVIEISKPVERSFVVGWPTTNCVWTFSSAEEKEIWWQSLQKNITVQRDREEPKTVNLKVLNRESNSVHSVTLRVGNTDTADGTLSACLQQFRLNDASPEDYGLWVQSGKDSSAYPLIGHEIPYAIKMSHLHEALSKHSHTELFFPGDDAIASAAIDDTALIKQHKCQFLLRKKGNSHMGISVDTSAFPTHNKRMKKVRKAHFKLSFKKNISGKGDSPDAFSPPLSPNSKLFGIPLPILCQEPNNTLPGPITDLLTIIYHNGPYTTGIFRKSANARVTRELKNKLCCGESVSADDVPVTVAAALLKDFLRNIPNSLMYNVLYENWLNTIDVEGTEARIDAIKSILNDIPGCHRNLLRHMLCIMYRINQHSDDNNMTSYNQAVCCSPSMLWLPSCSPSNPEAQVRATEKVPQIVLFMVDHTPEICGQDVLDLFGGPPVKRPEPNRRDSSGDSDSLHGSVESGGMKRDDDSLDSIDRELYANEGWPNALHVTSPSSLSRDSGLTSSDNQLYPESDTTDTTDSGFDAKDRLGPSSSPGPATPSLKHVKSASSLEQVEGEFGDATPLKLEVVHVRRVSEPNASVPQMKKRYILTTENSQGDSLEGSDNEVELSEETVQMIRQLSQEGNFKLFGDLLPQENADQTGDELDKRRKDYLESQKHPQTESVNVVGKLSKSSLMTSMDLMGNTSGSSSAAKNTPPQKQKQRRISVPAKFYNPLSVFHKKTTSSPKHAMPSTSESESPSSGEKFSPAREQSPRPGARENKMSPVPQPRSRRPRISMTRLPGKLSPDGHRRSDTYPKTSTPPSLDVTHLALPHNTRRESPSSPRMTRSTSDDQIAQSYVDTEESPRTIRDIPSPQSSSSLEDSPRHVSPPSYQETMHRRARLQHQSHSQDSPELPVFEEKELGPRRRRSGAISCSIPHSGPLCHLPHMPHPKSPSKTPPFIESGIIFHTSDSESSDDDTVDIESLRLFASSPNAQQAKEDKRVKRTSSDRSERADGRSQSFINAMANGVQRTLSDKQNSEASRERHVNRRKTKPTAETTTPPRTKPAKSRSRGALTRSRSMEEDKGVTKKERINSVDSAISTSSEASPISTNRASNFPHLSQVLSAANLSPRAKSNMVDYTETTDPHGRPTCKETDKNVPKPPPNWRQFAKRHSVGFLDELDRVEFTEESYV